MVRLKQRYILFEILFPPGHSNSSYDFSNYANYSDSKEDALLSLHQSSPSSINQKTLNKTIRKVIQDHYGDMGSGMVGNSLSIKYFSNKTSTGIVRCNRESFQVVVAALALINRIEGSEVIVSCVHVSGTIKKCQEHSIERSRNLMRMAIKRNPSNIKNMTRYEGDGFDIIIDNDETS